MTTKFLKTKTNKAEHAVQSYAAGKRAIRLKFKVNNPNAK